MAYDVNLDVQMAGKNRLLASEKSEQTARTINNEGASK